MPFSLAWLCKKGQCTIFLLLTHLSNIFAPYIKNLETYFAILICFEFWPLWYVLITLVDSYFVRVCRLTTTYLIAARALPFRVGVNFNRDEADETGESDAMAETAENSEVPGGIIGFKLTFFQGTC